MVISKNFNNKDLKVTVQRGVVLKVFHKDPERHWSVNEVIKEIHIEYPEMGRSKVHRTLNLLVELGILNKIYLPIGKVRYEMKSDDGHQHHHLICLECGQVYDFKADSLETLESEATNKGFIVYNHQLNFYGICKYCKAYEKEVKKGL